MVLVIAGGVYVPFDPELPVLAFRESAAGAGALTRISHQIHAVSLGS